jgi:hypothetical protein
MSEVSATPAILISRVLPDEAVRLARSRARVDIHDGEAPLRKPELPADAATERGLNATRADLPTLLRESDFVSTPPYCPRPDTSSAPTRSRL